MEPLPPPPGRLILQDSEREKIRRDLALSDTERFFKLMKLVRLHHMLKNANVEHKLLD